MQSMKKATLNTIIQSKAGSIKTAKRGMDMDTDDGETSPLNGNTTTMKNKEDESEDEMEWMKAIGDM